MHPLGQTVLWHILHGSLEGPNGREPQSLSAMTSTITFCCIGFSFFSVSLFPILYSVSLGLILKINCLLVIPVSDFVSWGTRRIRRYPSLRLKPNEEYIYMPNSTFFFPAADLTLLNCDTEFLYFTFPEDS